METLTAKYWAGWMKYEEMENPEWEPTWFKAAINAQLNNQTLVVFRVPNLPGKKMNIDAIIAIEQLLKDWFDKSKFDE